jgi:predicted nucleotidyltransferase component of viral defense system
MNPHFDTVIGADPGDRRDTFEQAAQRMGTSAIHIEKDFWVCWILDLPFNGRADSEPRLLFKGGTSLSKGYSLINRFSEDIDVTVFRGDLAHGATFDELEKMSRKKRDSELAQIKEDCSAYIQGPLQRTSCIRVCSMASPAV